MPDYIMTVQTEYGIQERAIVAFEPAGDTPSPRRPIPMLLNGEKIVPAPGGGVLIVRIKYKKRG